MIRCLKAPRFAMGRSISFWLALSTAASGVHRQLRRALPRVYAAASSSATNSAALAWQLPHRRCSARERTKPSAPQLHVPWFLATVTRAGTSYRRRRTERLFASSSNMENSGPAPYGWSPIPPRESNESNRQRRRQQPVNLGLKVEDNQESQEVDQSTSITALSKHPADDNGENIRGRQSFADRGRRRKEIPSLDGGGSNDSSLKRKKRPGHNSYLKVVLDDATLERLHGAVLRIRDRVQQMDTATPLVQGDTEESTIPSSNGSSDNGTPSSDQTASATKLPIVSVRPRSRHSLHMTLLFGGEVLCQLSKEALVEFHTNVSAALLNRREPPMFVQHATTDRDDDIHPERDATTPVVPEAAPTSSFTIQEEKRDASQCFRLVEVRTFPPRRNNLIVAVFEPPTAWNEVHDDLRRVALRSSSSGIRNVAVAASGGPKWIAHVTLANLVVRKRHGQQQQQQQAHPAPSSWKSQLQDLLEKETRRLLVGGADAGAVTGTTPASAPRLDESLAVGRRIAMGGPVPDEVELDWTFHVVPSTYSTVRK